MHFNKKHYKILGKYLASSLPHKRPWMTSPQCTTDFERRPDKHLEPETHEDMLEILALVRNVWLGLDAFWLGFVFDKQLSR